MWTRADLKTLFSKGRALRLRLRKGWMHRILVAWIMLGVIGVPLIVWSRKQALESSKRRDLHHWCVERARLLEDQVVLNKNMAKTFTELILVFGSYNGTNTLTDSIFRRFCDETSYAHPMVLGLTYSVYLTQAERPAFETSTGMVITDILTGQRRGTQFFYLVVIYANTMARQFVGCDMLSLPENYEAFTKASQLQSGVMTVPYSLLLDGNIGTGVLFPVFKWDPGPNATRDVLDEALLGEVICVMDFEVLIGNLLQQLYNPRFDFVFEVYDIADVTKPIPLYRILTRVGRKRGSEISSTILEVDRSDSVIALDFDDPFRRHAAVCRIGDDASGWGWYSLSWGLLFTVIVILVGYILRTASKQMIKMEQNYSRMETLKTRAELADKAKSNFLTTVSHEIRTPMNGVLGMLDSLLETKLDGQQSEFANIAHSSGAALVSLINDVLDMAKIQSGHMTLDKVVFYIRMLVDETLDVFRANVREKGLEVAVLVDDEVPDMLEGDPGRLRQVLVNLLGNSIKFTEAGHVLLHISVLQDEAKCRKAAVDDQAGGFPKGESSRKGNLRRRSSFGKARKIVEGPQRLQYLTNLARIPRVTIADDPHEAAPKTGLGPYDSLSGFEATDTRNSWSQIVRQQEYSPGSRDSHSSLEATPSSIYSHKSESSTESGLIGSDGYSPRTSTEVSPRFGKSKSTHPRDIYAGSVPRSTRNTSLGGSSRTGSDEMHLLIDQPRPSVVLSVVCEDTGAGMPEEAEIRIFQPFMQADSSTSRKYGGTGIGLSVSRQVVQMMGGDLKYVTRRGVGATFEFTAKFDLPEEQRGTFDPYKNYGVSPSALSSLQGKIILLIDGLPIRRMVTENVLSRLGISCHSIEEPNLVVELVSDYYRRCLNMDIPQVELADLAESLSGHDTRYHSKQGALGKTCDTDTHQDVLCPSSSQDTSIRDDVGRARRLSPTDGTSGDQMFSATMDPAVNRMALSIVVEGMTDSGGATGTAEGPSSIGPNTTALRELIRYEVILVDINAFGKNTGLELGTFVQSHKPGDTRYTSKSRAVEGKERAKHFPPLILLACKAEERDHEIQQMGFANKMFKPLKVAALVDSLAEVTASDWQRPVLSRASTLERLSARKALTDLLKGRRFLVVDDNMVNRIVAKRMLERFGAAVVAVDGGQSAIDKLKVSCDFDTVFMDIQMPEMDGFEATERIRALEARGELGKRTEVSTASTGFARLNIVALTADVFGANRSKCEDSGMDGYITKPLEERQFYKTMEHVFSANSTRPVRGLNPFDGK